MTGGGVLAATTGAGAQAQFMKLYNGQDLSGWHVQNGKIEAWKANGEMISCVAPGGGWLTSDKEYGDFVFRIEWKIGPAGNSGIGIRYPAQGDPAHIGMEIQILDDDAPQYKNLKAAQYCGGIYYQVPPKLKAAKAPGEWNRYNIRCQGSKIVIRLNGMVIQDVDVATVTTAEGNYKPLSERPRRGFVGMQSHGDQCDFRNVEIREL